MGLDAPQRQLSIPRQTVESLDGNVAASLLEKGRAADTALFVGQREVSYDELRGAFGAVASLLASTGCPRQARIGICAENGLFFAAAYLGAIRAGLVAVPLQPELSPGAFISVVSQAEIRVLLVSSRNFRRVARTLEGVPVSIIAESQIRLGGAACPDEWPLIEPCKDLAALMFTSGSTGQPKGVMVSHRNIECNTQDILDYMALTPADRAMVVLPFHYCFGLSLLHTVLAAGGSLVINNAFLYPEEVLREMEERSCTGLAGVPSTYQILLRKTRFKEIEFPSLAWLQQAGGKLPNPYLCELVEAFPRTRIYTMYGQTEATARLSFLPPELLAERLGSIGKGLASTNLEVLKDDGKPVRPGSEEVGEIVASGDNVTLGYWNDPEETSKYFRGGRLFTGDLAKVDSDGFIYIVEREREIVKSGGHRVSAKEIEEVICGLPSVIEAAVIGVPDDQLGEAICAFVSVVGGGPSTTSEILDHCRHRLPPFKVPMSVRILPALPHNASGKIIKAELRKLVIDSFPSSDSRPSNP